MRQTDADPAARFNAADGLPDVLQKLQNDYDREY